MPEKYKLTKLQLDAFAKGYQAQHDDMFSDLMQHFSRIQDVMLDYPDYKSMETPEDFEDFGRQAFLYKLEQYCKQARLLREVKDLPNLYENECSHEALQRIVTLNGDEYDICPICNYTKKIE